VLLRTSLALVTITASLGLLPVSIVQADEPAKAAQTRPGSPDASELSTTARRAARSGSTVRLIVDATNRREIAALGVDVQSRIGTLPQFQASASAAAISRVIGAGLAHAVSVDRWIPKPRQREVSPSQGPSSRYTDVPGIIGATSLRQAGIDGAGTAVAVLDDGIDAAQPYFRRGAGSAIVAQGCFVTYFTGAPPELPCAGNQSQVIGPDAANVGSNERFWHGTHVAGIVAGNPTGIPQALDTWGVAPGANLVIGRVFGGMGANTSDILAGLDWVASIADRHNIVSVNLSLGLFLGSRVDCTMIANAEYGAVVRRLASAGVAVVAAAGNDGNPTAMGLPACATGIVSVGATNADNSIAEYSNIAETTDLLAPGSNILSSVPGDKFLPSWGTSMATPVVSGAYALAHQANSTLGNESWLTLFRDNALAVNDLVVKGLPLVQVDVASRKGAGMQLTGRPTNITVTESGLSSVSVAWSPALAGPRADDYLVTVGSRTVVASGRSIKVEGVLESPAPVTVVGRIAGVPGMAGQGPSAFPIDPSLGSVVAGTSIGKSEPYWSYCRPNAPSMTLTYLGPEGSKLRTLRVSNGRTIQVVAEAAVVGNRVADRSLLITKQGLWSDPATVVQVMGSGGRLGPRWSLGSLVSNAEQYSPPPPRPTQVRAASKKRALAVTWAPNGASAWRVYLDGRSVMTVSSPRAQIPASPGEHTVGVCALNDSAAQVRGSVLVTASGQALK